MNQRQCDLSRTRGSVAYHEPEAVWHIMNQRQCGISRTNGRARKNVQSPPLSIICGARSAAQVPVSFGFVGPSYLMVEEQKESIRSRSCRLIHVAWCLLFERRRQRITLIYGAASVRLTVLAPSSRGCRTSACTRACMVCCQWYCCYGALVRALRPV